MAEGIDVKKLKEKAVEAAKEAGAVLKHYFEGDFSIREKKGAGLVTTADTEAEEKAISILKEASSQMDFLAEESAHSGKKFSVKEPVGRWILDPLDGTTNFIHGFPMFCVSIAAEVEDQLKVGVIYHPILDELYVGVDGEGAFFNGKPLGVSQTKDLKDSLLTTGFAYLTEEELHKEISTFEALSQKVRAVRRPGSAALDLAYVARGVFDGFWEKSLNAWDVAAGTVLVQEAGGKITDFRGKPLDLNCGQIIASNSCIHPELTRMVGKGLV